MTEKTRNQSKGRSELVYLRPNLFELAERVKEELGLSRSAFYRYCIMKTLDSMSVLSDHVKRELKEDFDVQP
jgi:hypothetical protein